MSYPLNEPSQAKRAEICGHALRRKPYQPKTGAKCSCRPGIWRDNCPQCEGTGWVIDFRAIRERPLTQPAGD